MRDEDYMRHDDGIGMKVPLRPCETIVYSCPDCEATVAMDTSCSVDGIDTVRCANCDVYMEWK